MLRQSGLAVEGARSVRAEGRPVGRKVRFKALVGSEVSIWHCRVLMVERDKAFFDLSFGRFVAKPEILQRGCYGTAATFLQPKET